MEPTLDQVRQVLKENLRGFPDFVSYYGVYITPGYVYLGKRANTSSAGIAPRYDGCIVRFPLTDVLNIRWLPEDTKALLVPGKIIKDFMTCDELRKNMYTYLKGKSEQFR